MRSRLASLLGLIVLLGVPCYSHADQSRADLLQSLLEDLGIAPGAKQQVSSEQLPDKQYFGVTYNKAMQPLISIVLGGQKLDLVFATRSGNTFVFAKEKEACNPKDLGRCYSLDEALHSERPMRICQENADRECLPGHNGRYVCRNYIEDPSVDNLIDNLAHSDQLVIDGVHYSMKGLEAEDIVLLEMHDMKTDKSLPIEVITPLPFRLLLSKLEPPKNSSYSGELRPPLFEGTSGLFGAAGASLSCRVAGSIWDTFLEFLKCASFRLDFRPPERAGLAFAAEASARQSSVLLNPAPRNGTIWSEPKQMGDYLHSGLHGFILYHPTVCGADLLRSLRDTSSSNWFAVVDTSGPCLTLPPFLFDRLMAHVPVKCPFKIGEPSLGRLCAPDRTRSLKRLIGSTTFDVSLPALTFTLEDERRAYSPTPISLPLERLVFDADPDKGGAEKLLCVARSDTNSWDMMHSYISFGSLAVAAVTPEIDLQRFRVGLSSRCNVSLEATDNYCAEKTVCVSPMQDYDESSNECQDPQCSRYMFMTLDNDRKVCTWSALAPVSLGIAIAALVVLDLFSHKLYKQAIERAKTTCQ